jgi:hypothetical protein
MFRSNNPGRSVNRFGIFSTQPRNEGIGDQNQRQQMATSKCRWNSNDV